MEPGSTVDVADMKGAFIGRGYVNPHSLIAVRLLSRRKVDVDDPAFWKNAIRSAVSHRQRLFPDRRSVRLIHAEGDGLPGLVVDRYEDVLSVQLTTAGTEVRKDLIADALKEIVGPAGAVLRSEGRARKLEGLDEERRVWFGEVPEAFRFDELGVSFQLRPLEGQKTGHFLDQAVNRANAGSLCKGLEVLDMYSHSGGWALQALRQGASRAVIVDKSEPACDLALANADHNGFGDKVDVIQGEGRAFLMDSVGQSHQYGAVVLDPPAFAKTRKAAGSALRGYQDINTMGLRLIAQGGYLFTSSCSYHVEEGRFAEVIAKAAQTAGRRLRLVWRGEQAADHPVRLEIPETRYLKHYAFQVEMGA